MEVTGRKAFLAALRSALDVADVAHTASTATDVERACGAKTNPYCLINDEPRKPWTARKGISKEDWLHASPVVKHGSCAESILKALESAGMILRACDLGKVQSLREMLLKNAEDAAASVSVGRCRLKLVESSVESTWFQRSKPESD